MTDRPDPVDVFRAMCEARARLYAEGVFDLHQAVDVLQGWAEHKGLVTAIGNGAVLRIMATAMMAVRDDL